jgi:hypothetical protein
MTPARHVLERLFRRAEAAARKGSAAPASLPMTPASCPEYAALNSLSASEHFHAEIAMAERDGAIAVERDHHHADGSGLKRLQVRDISRLAAHLGQTLHTETLQAAQDVLAPWKARFPLVDSVLSAWAAGRKVRSQGPDAAHDLRDALRVAAEAGDATTGERILRRESVRLFGDSKRIEALTHWLDVLATGDTASSGLSREDVWSAFGLRRQPQPLLLAGRTRIRVAGVTLPLFSPYLGLPPEQIEGIDEPVSFVLTIENLTSFHDAASVVDPRSRLILYTGGMPSPAWRTAWQRMLASLPSDTPIYHWGDIDEGGFRIAHAIQRASSAVGRAIRPWMMSPESLPSESLAHAALPTSNELQRMCATSEAAGWRDVAHSLRSRPIRLEQEALVPRLPPCRPCG